MASPIVLADRQRWLLVIADGEGQKTRWRFRATRRMAERLLALITSSSRGRAGVLLSMGREP